MRSATATIDVRRGVPLAPLTTLELGGPARLFVRATTEDQLIEALQMAQRDGLPVLLLGGGSNVVISDEGFDGLVIQIATRGWSVTPGGELEAEAGEPWDPLVAEAVARGLAGIECLSGIPGLVGATPIQNVGAYGQEVGDVIASVRLLHRDTLTVETVAPDACEFSYRDSVFKRHPDTHVVLGVRFALRPAGEPTVAYAELQRAVSGRNATLADVRDAVLDLRRGKSMVIDPGDPNRRSVGSFFTNPILPVAEADRVERLTTGTAMPRFPAGKGRVKVPAAWLIEQAGIGRGMRHGAVGISSRHTLALVHHGGGSTHELLELAAQVRDRVRERFGVMLTPEPVFVGAAL